MHILTSFVSLVIIPTLTSHETFKLSITILELPGVFPFFILSTACLVLPILPQLLVLEPYLQIATIPVKFLIQQSFIIFLPGILYFLIINNLVLVVILHPSFTNYIRY